MSEDEEEDRHTVDPLVSYMSSWTIPLREAIWRIYALIPAGDDKATSVTYPGGLAWPKEAVACIRRQIAETEGPMQ